MCSFLCAFFRVFQLLLDRRCPVKVFLKSINALCVQTLPVDDIFLELKAFRVEGEFYFQRD